MLSIPPTYTNFGRVQKSFDTILSIDNFDLPSNHFNSIIGQGKLKIPCSLLQNRLKKSKREKLPSTGRRILAFL